MEITWNYKVEELNSGAIDCVWNGMTLNDEVKAAMGTSGTLLPQRAGSGGSRQGGRL